MISQQLMGASHGDRQGETSTKSRREAKIGADAQVSARLVFQNKCLVTMHITVLYAVLNSVL